MRNTEALVMAILLPIMLMLLFTCVFGGAIDPSGHYVNYAVQGIILLCAGFGSSSMLDVATDMTNGIIDRFRTVPIRSSHAVMGHVVASLARNQVATGVVIGVAPVVRFRPSANVMEWLAAAGVTPYSFLHSPGSALPSA
jgi:ABC-2 type transport system permease protein